MVGDSLPSLRRCLTSCSVTLKRAATSATVFALVDDGEAVAFSGLHDKRLQEAVCVDRNDQFA
jgi:hypothetical protein